MPTGRGAGALFAYAGGLLLIGGVLLAAGLWLWKREAGSRVAPVAEPEPRNEPVAKAEWKPAEFGGFAAGMLIDRTPAFAWDEVPAFRIDAEWRGLEVPDARENGFAENDVDEVAQTEPAAGFSPGENWREPAGLFFRPDIDPRVVRYKIDPSFGFENRERLLKGMMIRVQVSF